MLLAGCGAYGSGSPSTDDLEALTRVAQTPDAPIGNCRDELVAAWEAEFPRHPLRECRSAWSPRSYVAAGDTFTGAIGVNLGTEEDWVATLGESALPPIGDGLYGPARGRSAQSDTEVGQARQWVLPDLSVYVNVPGGDAEELLAALDRLVPELIADVEARWLPDLAAPPADDPASQATADIESPATEGAVEGYTGTITRFDGTTVDYTLTVTPPTVVTDAELDFDPEFDCPGLDIGTDALMTITMSMMNRSDTPIDIRWFGPEIGWETGGLYVHDCLNPPPDEVANWETTAFVLGPPVYIEPGATFLWAGRVGIYGWSDWNTAVFNESTFFIRMGETTWDSGDPVRNEWFEIPDHDL